MENSSKVTGGGTRPVTGPAPRERMQDKRADAAAEKEDDSVSLGIRSDKKPTPTPNLEGGD